MYGSDTRWICSALSHWDESSTLDWSDITSLNTKSFIKSKAALLCKNKFIFVESSMGLEQDTLNPLDWILWDWIWLICRLRRWRERRAEKDGRFLVFLQLIFNFWPLCSLQMFPCTSVSIRSWRSKWEPSKSCGSAPQQTQLGSSIRAQWAGRSSVLPMRHREHSRGYQELSCSSTSLCSANRWRNTSLFHFCLQTVIFEENTIQCSVSHESLSYTSKYSFCLGILLPIKRDNFIVDTTH